MTKKRLYWVASSQKDLGKFPKSVKDQIVFALELALRGGKHLSAKPFKGCGGGTAVMEVVQRGKNGTFRLLYAARFENALYVLHAFQKKSKTGIKTPKNEVDLIKERYKKALEHHKTKQAIN